MTNPPAYDRAEMDRQYNARETVAAYDDELARYRAESDRVRADIPHERDIVYDERSGERLDFYPAEPGAPLFVWIHGGYWRALSKDDNAFAARGLHGRGFHVAVLDYTLVPGADLDEIVRQVRAATAFLARNRDRFRIGPQPFAVGGSSAGGQLVGMLLADGWTAGFGIPADTIGVGLALSGVHDLEPLRHSYVNDFMRFDDGAVDRNSPVRHVPHGSDAILLAAAGGDETDEFKRQTAGYIAAWEAAGNRAEPVDMPGHHHFDIALSLTDPDGTLARAVEGATTRAAAAAARRRGERP